MRKFGEFVNRRAYRYVLGKISLRLYDRRELSERMEATSKIAPFLPAKYDVFEIRVADDPINFQRD